MIRRALLLVGLLSPPLVAQDQRPAAGVIVSASASAVRSTSDSAVNGRGALLGVGLGYAITPRLEIGIGIDLGGVRTPDASRLIGHCDIGARLFLLRRRIAPYLEAALASRGVDAGDDRQLLGLGLSTGAGFEVFAGRHTSIDVGFSRWSSSGDDLMQGPETLARDVSGSTARFRVGIRRRVGP
jgi:hypothetical protein